MWFPSFRNLLEMSDRRGGDGVRGGSGGGGGDLRPVEFESEGL